MRSVLFLLFISLHCFSTTAAAYFSCRDDQGKLYLTDNPQNLPEACRKNLNYVDRSKPAAITVPSAQSDARQEASLEQLNQEEQQKRQVENYRQRAAATAEKYARGAELLKKSEARWHYGYKAEREEGGRLVREAQQEKLQLLDELEPQTQLEPQRSEIVKQLDPVP